MTLHQRATKPISDDRIDEMDARYRAEYDRWCVRCRVARGKGNHGYELVRNTSPNNDIIDESYREVITLTLREARNYDDAEAWLRTFAGRAAMRAALGAL